MYHEWPQLFIQLVDNRCNCIYWHTLANEMMPSACLRSDMLQDFLHTNATNTHNHTARLNAHDSYADDGLLDILSAAHHLCLSARKLFLHSSSPRRNQSIRSACPRGNVPGSHLKGLYCCLSVRWTLRISCCCYCVIHDILIWLGGTFGGLLNQQTRVLLKLLVSLSRCHLAVCWQAPGTQHCVLESNQGIAIQLCQYHHTSHLWHPVCCKDTNELVGTTVRDRASPWHSLCVQIVSDHSLQTTSAQFTMEPQLECAHWSVAASQTQQHTLSSAAPTLLTNLGSLFSTPALGVCTPWSTLLQWLRTHVPHSHFTGVYLPITIFLVVDNGCADSVASLRRVS